MIALLATLIPLLVIDALNPVLFALLIVAVSSRRPMANGSALLAGHTVAYFLSGVSIALGLDRITDRLDNPQTVDFVVELLLGLACLWAALAARDGKASENRNPAGELTPVFCFGYGALVNFIGVPFALPYFAAVDQIMKADLTAETSLVALAIYNAAYALPYVLALILVALMGEQSRGVLETINKLLIGLVDRFMPVALLLLGVALTADAITFLVSGETLW